MAARSLNRVTLIGNLTRDPELKYTPQGTAVCTFGVATNRSWTTTTGELKEEAQFHRIVAWQKVAELCGKLLSKGKKVYLEGRLTYRTYTGKDGVQRTITEIVLDDFIIFDNNRKGEENQTQTSEANNQKQNEQVVEETTEMPAEEDLNLKPEEVQKTKEKKEDEEDSEKVNPDDIPF